MAIPGGLTAVVGTLLLAAAFYTVTVHVAARFVLGKTPLVRAVVVGVVLAVVQFLLQQYGPAVTIAVTAVADLLAIRMVYRLKFRSAAVVAAAHYAIAVVAGLAVLFWVGR